jgi:hypothetical protein
VRVPDVQGGLATFLQNRLAHCLSWLRATLSTRLVLDQRSVTGMLNRTDREHGGFSVTTTAR